MRHPSRSSPACRRLDQAGRGHRAARIAGLAIVLLLAGGLPAIACAAVDGPPDLSERQRSGLDLRQPLLLALEWSTPDTPANVEAVSSLLARHGFTVERSRLRAAGGQPLGHVLRARRIGTVAQPWLDTVARALTPLVGNQGELRWALAPTTEAAAR